MKDKYTRHITRPDHDSSHNHATPDQRLESAVDQLLDNGEERDAEPAGQIESPSGRNGAGGESNEQEIEALLERMIFSERAFLEYSH